MRDWLQRHRDSLLVLLFFGLVSAAWSWPLVLSPTDRIVGRYFDGFGAVWLAWAAPSLDWSMYSELAAFPHGQVLRRADSQLMLLLARGLVPMLGPVLFFNLFVLVGPVLTAWGAEHFARRVLGAARPWSLLAGLSFAFCGLGATSVLEGHAYFLLMPWLPLLATRWWAATRPDGSLADGLSAGLFWVLCLLTSGYVGLLGALVVVAVGVEALWRRRIRWRPALAAAGVALPAGLIYVLAFVSGGDEAAQFYTAAPVTGVPTDVGAGGMSAQLRDGSAKLLQLLAVRRVDDRQLHGIAPALSVTALVLSLLASRVLSKREGYHERRVFTLLGALGVALSLGPVVELVEGPVHELPWIGRWLEAWMVGDPATGGGPPWPGFPNLPWLLAPLTWLKGDPFLHFPYRFAWLAALGFGGIGAAVATQLARDLTGRRRLLVGGLLLAGLVDALVRPGLWWRATELSLDVPAAYQQVAETEGAVLELWPRPAGGATDVDLRMNNLSCTWQRVHQRPTLSDCIGTGLARSPRVRLTRWLFAQVLDEEGLSGGALRQRLAELGVGVVVVHPLLFDEEDLQRVEEALTQALGAPMTQSGDAGAPVVVWAVPGTVSPREPALTAWNQLSKEGW